MNAVFLSYAREDATAARRIAEALRAAGVEVWFDENELRGGDQWDTKIRRQIDACALFIPLISRHTQERSKGYFRLEWKLAVEQTHLLAEGVPFIAPVVIDDTAETRAVVPAEFMRVQWTRLPAALPTPQLVEQVKRLLQQRATPREGSDAPLPQGRTRAFKPAGKSRSPLAISAAVGVVAAVAALVWFGASKMPSGPGPSQPVADAKSAAAAAPGPTLPPVANNKSIAVLPFDNRSSEQDTAYFTDGVHEDVITNLALIRELRVVPRTSVAQYRATTKPIRQIGQELDVAYVFTGSVQRAGGKVRVTGQLINARTDEQVWASNYHKDLTDVFAIQSEIAHAIAAALQAKLSPQEKTLLARRPTENPAAYDLYLRAREFRGLGNDYITIGRQETLLQAAVELDPKFAAAWAQLCFVHGWLYYMNQDVTPARKAKARSAMEAAMRLAPQTPEAMRAVGDYSYYCLRDFNAAVAHYNGLLQSQPNYSDGHLLLAAVYQRQAKWVDALAATRKVVELVPGDLVGPGAGALARIFFYGGRRYAEARVEYERLERLATAALDRRRIRLELAMLAFHATGSTREGADLLAGLAAEDADAAPATRREWTLATGDSDGYLAVDARQAKLTADGVTDGLRGIYSREIDPDINVAAILLARGDSAAARERLRNTGSLQAQLQMQPENARLLMRLSASLALLGDKEAALRHARRAAELCPEAVDAVEGPRRSANLAFVLAWVGEKDAAIAEYGRLLRIPFNRLNVHQMKRDPRYHPLRGDPRFEALLNDPKNNAPLF